jgi:threonine/homoserine/homoserine lactone efflux protein
MDPEVVAVALVPGASVVALMALTAIGGRRRGRGLGLALVAGLFFPVTWAVWYLLDEHPGRSVRRA